MQLKKFYQLINDSRKIKKELTENIFFFKKTKKSSIKKLEYLYNLLKKNSDKNFKISFTINKNKKINTEIKYELIELEKDLIYLKEGEEKLIKYLSKLNKNFYNEAKLIITYLENIKKFNLFATDRDGTINNYCSRYRTSVQSIYNSIFLSNFNTKLTNESIIITSAPLSKPGITDISIDPVNLFVYAASKGREFISHDLQRYAYPIKSEQQMLLDTLNQNLISFLKKNEIFTLIGSGLQFKFGQTTIARQDITNTIAEVKSLKFMDEITKLLRKIDPASKFFEIEDTGKDIEIILKLEEKNKDFDKADGLNFITKQIKFDLSVGPNLICGDTSSDIPILNASLEKCKKNTYAVFVSQDPVLIKKLKKILKNIVIVSNPDVLVYSLYKLSVLKKEKA